jgi:hypothetical protein
VLLVHGLQAKYSAPIANPVLLRTSILNGKAQLLECYLAISIDSDETPSVPNFKSSPSLTTIGMGVSQIALYR